MKHLKLYEDFDHYEFGTRDPLTYIQMRKEVQDFPDDLKRQVSDILRSNNIRYDDGNINENDRNSYIFMMDFSDVCIEIYYLGDYCYGVYAYNSETEDDGTNIYLEVVDDIDQLLPIINRLASGFGISLNETIDRHEYGEYNITDHLSFNTQVTEVAVPYNVSDLDDIKALKIFDDNIEVVESGGIIIYVSQRIDDKLVYISGICYLGDYCYIVMDANRDKYFILDQFDSVIDKLKELLNIDNLNESLATHDRHDFGSFPLMDRQVQACQYMIDMGGVRVSQSEFDQIKELCDRSGDVSNVFFREMNGLCIIQKYKKYRHSSARYEDLLDFDVFSRKFVVYYLGDYCYGIIDPFGGKYYILDQFDSVLGKLAELLGVE